MRKRSKALLLWVDDTAFVDVPLKAQREAGDSFVMRHNVHRENLNGMAIMKCLCTVILILAIAVPSAASECWKIKDRDTRILCEEETKAKEESRSCWRIRDTDKRNLCEGKCDWIRDHDLRELCKARR